MSHARLQLIERNVVIVFNKDKDAISYNLDALIFFEKETKLQTLLQTLASLTLASYYGWA